MPERGKLSLLFVGAIAIPAVVLGTAAFRWLAQERARVAQEFSVRIRSDAAQAAGRLDEAVERLVSEALAGLAVADAVAGSAFYQWIMICHFWLLICAGDGGEVFGRFNFLD